MLIHWSFTADDPPRVAKVLAEILGGEIVEPPSPPYIEGGLWVCLFDEVGTLLEVGPRRLVWTPDEVQPAVEILADEEPRKYTYNHTLWRSAVSADRIRELAEAEGWHTVFFDGPFKFQAVWIENHQYIEFVPDELLGYYTKIHGAGATKETLEAHNRRVGDAVAKLQANAEG